MDDAELHARRADEIEALDCIFGVDCRIVGANAVEITVRADAEDGGGGGGGGGGGAAPACSCALRATLPPKYPAEEGPVLDFSLSGSAADAMSREQQRALTAGARAHAASLLGEECVWQVVEWLSAQLRELAEGHAAKAKAMAVEMARSAAESTPAAPGGAGGVGAGPGGGGGGNEILLLLIDHMNDGKGYSRKLAQWAGQLGLAGFQLARPAHAHAKAGRLEGIVVALSGEPAAHSEFLMRLRTHY